MPQQADGWLEPEFEGFRAESDFPLDLPWLAVSKTEPERGRLPWLETIKASNKASDMASDIALGETESWPGWLPKPEDLSPLRASWNPASSAQLAPLIKGAANGVAGLIHDARNLITTIDLYCDLLEVPGVLSIPFRSYAGDLRLIAAGSRRLIEKLAALELHAGSFAGSSTEPRGDSQPASGQDQDKDLDVIEFTRPAPRFADPYFFDSHDEAQAMDALSKSTSSGISLVSGRVEPEPLPLANCRAVQLEPDTPLWSETLTRGDRAQRFITGQPIQSLADEVIANQRLLAALSGPAITLGLTVEGGDCPIALVADDLTRILVNLVKNACEAMPGGGHIQIDLEESADGLTLSVADSGPGISDSQLESIFTAGFSTQVTIHPSSKPGAELDQPGSPRAWPTQHRGLGLAIVRSIVTSAGGTVSALNRDCSSSLHTPEGPMAKPEQRSHNQPYRFTSDPVPSRGRASEPLAETGSGAILRIRFPVASQGERHTKPLS